MPAPEVITRVRVVDSHTGGEPTRVIVDGPEVEGRTMAQKRVEFARSFDWLRSATVNEPRGHEAMIGALLCQPMEPDCVAGVIFFNNVGVLHGCIHGTIGVAQTLLHLGRISPGEHRLDTATGVVTIHVKSDGNVAVRNVRSYRHLREVEVSLPSHGTVGGDVAWGGNWFFLTAAPDGLDVVPENLEALTEFTWAIRNALPLAGITGEEGAEIDHIEMFGSADPEIADSRNFVLCPGKAYDRSPCGTGTSAKLACLHADDTLKPGQIWRQAGILNSVFFGEVESAPEGGVFPTVTGSAHVTLEADLILDPKAPFAWGIPSF